MFIEAAAERFNLQKERFAHPGLDIARDLEAVYGSENPLIVGLPESAGRLFDGLAREHTAAIVGVALGDEGKGRIVDNKLGELLKQVEMAYVVRFQGGSNAGHTVEKGSVKLALHQVPSGVLYPEAVGIMDRGMVIHPLDLRTEIEMVEARVGDLRGKVYLSQDAILVTDLERAEGTLNLLKNAKYAGSTGRGIGPAYSQFYAALSLSIKDFLGEDWRQVLGTRFDRARSEFYLYGKDLMSVLVPDYKKSLVTKQDEKRPVGTKEEFLDRLEEVRTWLIERQMVVNTFLIHKGIANDLGKGIIFEGAQALGLHAWLGTLPDVTSSDTSAYGIQAGTAFWRAMDVKERLGVFKVTYFSSVGVRQMPTQISLPKDLVDLPAEASSDQRWAVFVIVEGHEVGTTTNRRRDILRLDLSMLTYNCRMAGIEVLVGTHLDIARKNETIKVCTHYVDRNGSLLSYQPGFKYLAEAVPCYVELPSWDGEEARRARTYDELPREAKQCLAFIERRTGYPIVAVTTGPDRENLLQFGGYTAGK